MTNIIRVVLTILLASALVQAAGLTDPVPATSSKPRTLSIVPAEHGWTIHAVSVDAHDLLTSFAAAADLQMIVDDSVRRQVTIHIVDKPAPQVLATLVDAYGLSTAEVDGIIIISEGVPRTPSSYLLSDIASVTTKYVAPNQALQLLPVFLQGMVKVNTDQNALVLSGPKSVLAKFRQDVVQFDIPAEQIILDVKVVEFTDMDVDTFAAMIGNDNAKIGLTTDGLTGSLTLNALTKLGTQFFTHLQALVTKRKARVQANPRIATVSGQGASIFIGQQQYLSTPVNLPGKGQSNSIDAGVSLSVTPLTGGNGEIILDLNEEVSTLSAPDAVTGLPTKTTRTAKSFVRVRDGQTIVSGGLRQTESRSVRRAMPILGDIPLVGTFFRSKKTEQTKVDLAIFITARLLSRSGHLAPADEAALGGVLPGEERPQ